MKGGKMKLILERADSIQKIEVNDTGTEAFVFSKGRKYTEDLKKVEQVTDIMIEARSKIQEIFDDMEVPNAT